MIIPHHIYTSVEEVALFVLRLIVTVITIVMSEEQCQEESSLTLEESNKKRQASPTEKLKLEESEQETPLSNSVERKSFFEECPNFEESILEVMISCTPLWSDTDSEN